MSKLILVAVLMITLIGGAVNEQTAQPTDGSIIEATETVNEAEYRKITPEEARDMMVEGNIILDVRTPEEFAEGYIPGAMLLPVDSILDGTLDSLPDKHQTILVYCKSGGRSAMAANALVDAGYTGVYDFGGILDWPYEVVQ